MLVVCNKVQNSIKKQRQSELQLEKGVRLVDTKWVWNTTMCIVYVVKYITQNCRLIIFVLSKDSWRKKKVTMEPVSSL